MPNHGSIKSQVEILADLVGDNLIRLARALRALLEAKPEIFTEVAELAGVGRRRAYALAAISRQFDPSDVNDGRLENIGWTKLQIIGRYLTDGNADELLKLAEENTVHDLKTILKGRAPIDDAKVTVLYFSPQDHTLFTEVLIAHGAKIEKNGLTNREAALLTFIKKHYQNQ